MCGHRRQRRQRHPSLFLFAACLFCVVLCCVSLFERPVAGRRPLKACAGEGVRSSAAACCLVCPPPRCPAACPEGIRRGG
eukprot:1536370-Pyramimonas_sp.AAC.1